MNFKPKRGCRLKAKSFRQKNLFQIIETLLNGDVFTLIRRAKSSKRSFDRVTTNLNDKLSEKKSSPE